MIKPGKYNITAYQGATFDLNMNWAIGGTAVDLTGYTAAMQIRSTPSSPVAVVSLTNTSGITLGGTAGTIDIRITAATMGSVAPGQYVYDLELTQGTDVSRLMQGTFLVDAEVTR